MERPGDTTRDLGDLEALLTQHRSPGVWGLQADQRDVGRPGIHADCRSRAGRSLCRTEPRTYSDSAGDPPHPNRSLESAAAKSGRRRLPPADIRTGHTRDSPGLREWAIGRNPRRCRRRRDTGAYWLRAQCGHARAAVPGRPSRRPGARYSARTRRTFVPAFASGPIPSSVFGTTSIRMLSAAGQISPRTMPLAGSIGAPRSSWPSCGMAVSCLASPGFPNGP